MRADPLQLPETGEELAPDDPGPLRLRRVIDPGDAAVDAGCALYAGLIVGLTLGFLWTLLAIGGWGVVMEWIQ